MRRWGAFCAVAALVLGAACGGGGEKGGSRREAGKAAPAAPAPAAKLERFPVPGGSGPHDVAPAPDGTVWYTAQTKGALGRLDPATGRTTEVPLGKGSAPHGVIVGPDGTVWYASLTGNHIARVDPATGQATVIEPPTPNQGARRIWSDLKGRLWVSEWNAGQVGLYDPAAKTWKEWHLPGDKPQAYAVYV